MRKLFIVQTLVDAADNASEAKANPNKHDILTLFNTAMQQAGYGALEYHNCILTELELKKL